MRHTFLDLSATMLGHTLTETEKLLLTLAVTLLGCKRPAWMRSFGKRNRNLGKRSNNLRAVTFTER